MKNLKTIILISFSIILFTSCQKDYSLEGDNTKSVSSNKWQFRYFPTFYLGNITRAYVSNKTLYIKGKSNDSISNFQLTLSTTDSTFKIGEYLASLNESNFNFGFFIFLILFDPSNFLKYFITEKYLR